MLADVSVVIPTYNRAHLLKESLDSILRQTVPVREIIVVDDGSTDNTQELVRSYGQPVILLTQNRAGESAARNRGKAHASSEWIAFLDSDDVWRPTKIAKQLQYLEHHPSCDFIHTGYYLFQRNRKDIVVAACPHFLSDQYRVDYLLFGEPDWICPSTVLFRRNIPVTMPEWASGSTDAIFWFEFLRAGVQFGYVNEPLVGYRKHAGSMCLETKANSRGGSCLWQWVQQTYVSDPEEKERLLLNMLVKAMNRLERAKRNHNWHGVDGYDEWREWLLEHWLSFLPLPEAINEYVYPPVVYTLQDLVTLPFRKLHRLSAKIQKWNISPIHLMKSTGGGQ
jgi:glycosyltransferase involved in cell wall biosynthesis